ncbi:MAG TPA: M64 family metallopeptidase, partial [Chitinophagaceae bacterium]|nr:M64 family metallopeptidase [Chitinophagaceae bacterium]
YEAAGFAPAYDAIVVLVNDSNWGGCESDLVFSTIAGNFSQIITHELGHKIGDLADEYTYLNAQGTGSANYPGPEPQYVNVTMEKDRTKIKWAGYIQNSTPVPTTKDRPVGVVGLFEGGYYYPKRIYRPQYTCHMEVTSSEFCQVCYAQMENKLRQFCSSQ